jgi:hypothetical protein
MQQRDQTLIDAYLAVGQSVDRIAVFTEARNRFLSRLPQEAREPGDDLIIWRLVQLRKAKKLPALPSEN